MNPVDSCQRQQRVKMNVTQPKWRQFCVEDGGLLEIVFLVIKVTFVGSQFLNDFDSQNRCLCSRRSHEPLLRAFCLCFHFKRALWLVVVVPPTCPSSCPATRRWAHEPPTCCYAARRKRKWCECTATTQCTRARTARLPAGAEPSSSSSTHACSSVLWHTTGYTIHDAITENWGI